MFDLFLFHATNLPSNQERDTKNFVVLERDVDEIGSIPFIRVIA
jgi:hypothetical protein